MNDHHPARSRRRDASPGTPATADSAAQYREPSHAALQIHADPASPHGTLLFLHGGREDDQRSVPLLSLPAVRIKLLRRAVARTTGPRVRTACVRYRYRGWNGAQADAAADAWRALDQLAAHTRDLPPAPVVLVGHSMGGRAALRCAAHPLVSSIIGLAPWCPADEPLPSADVPLVLVHPDRDTVVEPESTWAFTARAARSGLPARAVVVRGGDHAMIRHAHLWHQLTAHLATALLGADHPSPALAALFDEPADRPQDSTALLHALRQDQAPRRTC